MKIVLNVGALCLHRSNCCCLLLCSAQSPVPQLQMKFSVQNMCPIEGEASVARFLYRLLAPYPSDPGTATLVDGWVDTAFWQLAHGSVKERRALTAALGANAWLCGPELTLADIACYCCTLQSGKDKISAIQMGSGRCDRSRLDHRGPRCGRVMGITSRKN